MVCIPVTLLGLYFGDVYFESRSIPVIGYLTHEFTDLGLPVALATVFYTVAVPPQILSHSFITFPLPFLPTPTLLSSYPCITSSCTYASIHPALPVLVTQPYPCPALCHTEGCTKQQRVAIRRQIVAKDKLEQGIKENFITTKIKSGFESVTRSTFGRRHCVLQTIDTRTASIYFQFIIPCLDNRLQSNENRPGSSIHSCVLLRKK